MNRDFPAYLFSHLVNDSENISNKSYESNFSERINYKHLNELDRLNFKHLIKLDLNKDENNLKDEIRCLTEKYYFGDGVSPITRLLPCSLPESNTYELEDDGHFDDSVWRCLNDSESQDLIYYIVTCKSISAKFYPQFFSRGTRGKCILTDDKQWLTPVEFKFYCGCWHNDWKNRIKLEKPNKSKEKKKRNTLKYLIENNELNNVHSYLCECDKCFDFSYLKSKNLCLLKTFFLNEDLIMIHPSKKDFTKLEINSIRLPKNFEFYKNGSNISETLLKNKHTTNIYKLKKNKINHLDFTKFNEYEYFNANSNEINEIFLNINYGSSKLKTIIIDNSNGILNIKDLYKIDFKNEKILGIAGSDFIKGECAVVTYENIYLTSPYNENIYTKVASDIEPCFKSDINFKYATFGHNPRQLIYTDYSQILNIDSRVKTNKNKEILKLPCKYLDKNELIYRSKKLDNDHNCHLVCCSNNVILIDERFTNYPLIKWKHGLKSSINLIESFSIDHDSYQTNICLFSDSKNLYCNQFSLKLNDMPLCQNYPLKLDSSSDFYTDMSEFPFHNKVLNRYLNFKSEKPILSLSYLKKDKNFAIFQYQQDQNIFYQCFDISKNCIPIKVSEDKNILKIWSTDLNDKVFNYLETSFEDLYLTDSKTNFDSYKNYLNKKAHEICKICNFKGLESLKYAQLDNMNVKNEICEKCGHKVSFSHNVFDNLKSYDNNLKKNIKYIKNIKTEYDDNMISDLTKELISIWPQKNDIDFYNYNEKKLIKNDLFEQPLSKRKRSSS